MKKILVLVAVLATFLWFCRDSSSVTAPGTDIRFDYVVRYPGDPSSSGELPLLVALHGNGDTPENFFDTALDGLAVPARVILLKGPLPMGTGGAWPMNPEGLRTYGEAVAAAIEVLAEKYPTRDRPVVMGFSGGAMVAYYLAAVYPDRFSHVVPVSGRLTPDVVVDIHPPESSDVRVHAFHGTRDQVIGIGGGRSAYEVLSGRNVAVEFREFEGDHLGVFREAKPEITAILDEALGGL